MRPKPNRHAHVVLVPEPRTVDLPRSERGLARASAGSIGEVRHPLEVLDVIGLGGAGRPCLRPGLPPLPPADLRHVLAVLGDVVLVLDELVADPLLEVRGAGPEAGNSVDDHLHQVEGARSPPGDRRPAPPRGTPAEGRAPPRGRAGPPRPTTSRPAVACAVLR